MARKRYKPEETGGIDFAVKANAFLVETESEAISNEGATTAEASRLRLILEGMLRSAIRW